MGRLLALRLIFAGAALLLLALVGHAFDWARRARRGDYADWVVDCARFFYDSGWGVLLAGGLILFGVYRWFSARA